MSEALVPIESILVEHRFRRDMGDQKHLVSLGDAQLPDRFWTKTQVAESTGCWLWMGARDGRGYGRFGWLGRNRLAHRVAYHALVGPTPDGLEMDHLCRVRPCVNPAHLEPVTHAENIRRGRSAEREKTHCPHGHPYDETNTRMYRGRRNCRACDRHRKAVTA